ncbi:MAG: substrate-binding domain-containing protein [Desulfobacterales bacterium]|nr:MAG: substrate-binding domain-containing protein [Desulfobacterales bacterium]
MKGSGYTVNLKGEPLDTGTGRKPFSTDHWIETKGGRYDGKRIFKNVGVFNSWRQQTTREVEYAATLHKDLIKEYIHTDANGSIPKQIADIQDLMAKGADILIVTPASPAALNPVLEKAYNAGIVVIVFNSNTTPRT